VVPVLNNPKILLFQLNDKLITFKTLKPDRLL
jgi:hypothetical protein